MEFDVAQDGGLDAGEGKEEAGIEACDGRGAGALGARRPSVQVSLGLDLGEGKRDGAGVAVESESVDPGTAGVAEAEELGDFVVGFAGGIVEGTADEGVVPSVFEGADEVQVGMAAGDDEG
jgi:hypothetical protein